ncbi:MAG: TonB-dependent receptor, partial [Acidobacteria bacterium]|nr:TonB-dependent receptor [Acidobacteriota bacterium]
MLDAGAVSAGAQLQTGNLVGRITDSAGAVLPGVTVTLDTAAAPQVQVTNARGEYRFLALSPAAYRVKADLAGFSSVEVDDVEVSIGRNTHLELVLSAAIKEEITVTTEGPLLDPKVIRAGTTLSQTELQEVPTTRDPWSLLQSTPGVLLDRVNVGGSESGRQAQYVGPGSPGSQSVWAVDGVVITDLAATGSSPAYYDFDSIEEMQVTTGGADATTATGGVVINLVTKRGTNQLRGSARIYYSGSGWSSASSFSNKELPPGQPPIAQLNKVDRYEDYGVEGGGPLWKDHLWLWGSYAGSELAGTQEGGGEFSASIPVWNVKLNGQITASSSATLFAMDSDKQRKGVGAGPTRPQPTTWDQSVFGGSPTIFKAEDTQIVGSNFYVTALYSHVYGGFAFIPESGVGPNVPAAFLDANGVWHNTFLFDEIKRPQSHERADLSNFFETGKVSHQLMYGAGYRIAQTVTNDGWPGGGWIAAPNTGGLPVPPGLNDLFVSRPALGAITSKSGSAYVEDTLSAGRLTANLGLRYEVETARNQAASAPANPQLPDLLPAVSYPGGPIGFTWKTLTPRLGLTWAAGERRQTLLRASYSRYADQLSQDPNHAGMLNPLNNIGYYYAGTTNQGDGRLTPSQVVPLGYGYTGNINPLTGGLLQSIAISQHLSA